ncbi:MAG: ABC transporter substrate-binding protein, partial [Candidatus Methylomirabilaceae bacterium]
MMLVAAAAALSITAPGLAQSKAALPDVPNPLVVEAADAGRFGGTFVVTSISDPRTFNRLVAQETSSTVPLGYMFEGLVQTNRTSTEVEPNLAESWTVSRDGRTWRFKMRAGVQWFDGKPVVADDVVFT